MQAKSIFNLYSLGISTNRDEWLIEFDSHSLENKLRFLISHYESRLGHSEVDQIIKWSETLLRRNKSRVTEPFSDSRMTETLYRPFVKFATYESDLYIDRPGLASSLFPVGKNNLAICFMVGDRQDFSAIATNVVPNLNMFSADAVQYAPLFKYQVEQNSTDNITNWALDKFKKHYQPGRTKPKRKIDKEAIFNYTYGVLHDPIYRNMYAQNLKREFPRIPFYSDFWQWADWGKELMDLHIGFESISPTELKRIDTTDEKTRKVGLAPKSMLKADKLAGHIKIDSETTLTGIPSEVWEYKLGNRSALEWILDQYKESKPKDPTIREKFDTYRFADYKEKVIELLMRVTTVSVRTVTIVQAMKKAAR